MTESFHYIRNTFNQRSSLFSTNNIVHLIPFYTANIGKNVSNSHNISDLSHYCIYLSNAFLTRQRYLCSRKTKEK